jgi:hypothetical protein
MITAKHRQIQYKEIISNEFFMGVTFKVQSLVSTGLSLCSLGFGAGYFF